MSKPRLSVRFSDEVEAAQRAAEEIAQRNALSQVEASETGQPSKELNLFITDYQGNLFGIAVQSPHPDLSTAFDEDETVDHDAEEIAALQKSNPLRALLNRYMNVQDETPKAQSTMKLQPFAAGEIHAGCIRGVAVFGSFVITGGDDESLRICRRNKHMLRKFSEYGALHKHDSSIAYVTFTPDGALLLSGDAEGFIYVWCTKRWECIGVLTGHRGAILGITVHPTSPVAMSIGKDNVLRVWDIRPGQFKQVVYVTLETVMPVWGTVPQVALGLKFSPEGETYAVAYPRHLTIYRTGGSAAVRIEDAMNLKIVSFSYVTETILAIGAEDGSIYLYDIADGLEESLRLEQEAEADGEEPEAEEEEEQETKYDDDEAEEESSPSLSGRKTRPTKPIQPGKKIGVLTGGHRNRVRFVQTAPADAAAELSAAYPPLESSSKFASRDIVLDTFLFSACSDGLIVAWRVVLSKPKPVSAKGKPAQKGKGKEQEVKTSEPSSEDELQFDFKSVSSVNTKARITGFAMNINSLTEPKPPATYRQCPPVLEFPRTKRSRAYEQDDVAAAATRHNKRIQREMRYGVKGGRRKGEDSDEEELYAMSHSAERYYDGDAESKRGKDSKKTKIDRQAMYGRGGFKAKQEKAKQLKQQHGHKGSSKPFGKRR